MTVTPPANLPAQRALLYGRLALFAALAVASILLAFASALREMIGIWMTSDTYAHGLLVVPIAAYLVYQLRAELAAAPQALAPWALLPLLLVGVGGALAQLADIASLQQLAMMAMVVCALWFLVGTAWLKIAWFPCLFLFLAVPFGDELTPMLIEHTADFVVAALRVSGVPVYREGTSFVIPSGSWSVVTACSGMRYLMATITIGSLFAHLSYRAVWKQALFVVVAIGVAILANWLRAYGIVMLAHLSDMRLATGVDHLVYGWVFFGLIIFLLMAVGGLWRDSDLTSTSAVDAALPALPQGVTLPALFVLLLSLQVVPLIVQVLAAVRPPLALAAGVQTLQLDHWVVAPTPAPTFAPEYAGTPTRLQGAFRQSEQTLGWQVAWYAQQSQGDELLNHANRLVGESKDAWLVLRRGVRTTGFAAVPHVIQTVLKARDSERVLVVWQWYWLDGATATNALAVKWLGVRGQLRQRGNAGASVITYVVLNREEEEASAGPQLDGFLRAFAPTLHAQFAASVAH